MFYYLLLCKDINVGMLSVKTTFYCFLTTLNFRKIIRNVLVPIPHTLDRLKTKRDGHHGNLERPGREIENDIIWIESVSSTKNVTASKCPVDEL